MQAKLEKIENSEAYIQIEIDAAKMEEGIEHAYRKIAKQVNVPGFRKGRAPRQLIESYYGKEVFYQDALEYVVPNAYEDAISSLELEPIAEPEFDIGDIEEDQPLIFTAIVAVKPEIVLGELEGLNITIPKYDVTEENVEGRIDQIRSNYAQIELKVDEPVESGDIVTIDFEGFLNGVAFEGGKGEDYPLEIGSNTFIPGFEEKLIGVKVGQVVDIDVTFPEDYHEESLAGQPVVFKVTMKEIETKKLRDLDDEFVQEVSEFDTVEEFKTDVRENLAQVLEKQKKELIRQEIIDKALAVCEVPAPKAVVGAQAERMLQDFEQRMSMQGLTMEQYFMVTQSSEEDFFNDIWPEAERNVKIGFMLEKLVEEKGFEVTDEEVDKQIEEIAESMGMDLETAKENFAGALPNIKFNMKIDKAIDYLIENANIVETEAENNADEESAETVETNE